MAAEAQMTGAATSRTLSAHAPIQPECVGGGWVSDRYEIVPDGTLTVTRTTGHYVTPTEPLARFVYTRGGVPPS